MIQLKKCKKPGILPHANTKNWLMMKLTFSFKKLLPLIVFVSAISSLSAATPYAHVYRGNSVICFFGDDRNTLTVTIDTDRLHLCSVKGSIEEYLCYFILFSDPEVMAKYASGRTKTKEEVELRLQNWTKRWNEKDPYSAFAVYKNDTGEFIGHVIAGHGNVPGQSELAYLFLKQYWGNGFGTEAVFAIVREYAPATVAEGYTLEGTVLERITATTRPDNIASLRILENLGMHKIGEEEKFGAIRYHFSIDLNELLTNE